MKNLLIIALFACSCKPEKKDLLRKIDLNSELMKSYTGTKTALLNQIKIEDDTIIIRKNWKQMEEIELKIAALRQEDDSLNNVLNSLEK